MPTLKGISIKTPSAKDECLEGEAFDFIGMVISANIAYVFIYMLLTVLQRPGRITTSISRLSFASKK